MSKRQLEESEARQERLGQLNETSIEGIEKMEKKGKKITVGYLDISHSGILRRSA